MRAATSSHLCCSSAYSVRRVKRRLTLAVCHHQIAAQHQTTPLASSLRRAARPTQRTCVTASAKGAGLGPTAAPKERNSTGKPGSAKEAIERGLEVFGKGDSQAALDLFQAALSLRPSQDEARAALYNGACARTRLRQWQEAADDVVRAINEFGLKYDVAAKDPDLRALRERREWLDATDAAVGGVSTRTLVSARTELRAPLRLVRLWASGGLAAGAGLGLLIITGRLVASLRGGEGAPDLTESLTNFAINSAALAALSWVFARDLRSQSRDRRVVEREEALARLQVRMGSERVVPLARLRGQVRPVLLAGSAGYVNRALKAAEPHRPELRARGVAVVPLMLSDADPKARLQLLKKQFRASSAAGSSAKGFGKAESTRKEEKRKDRRWELEAADMPEWAQWMSDQLEAAGIKDDGVYVQVQLDGSVRASGTGVPPWERWLGDLPELDSLQTKLTDGVGTSL